MNANLSASRQETVTENDGENVKTETSGTEKCLSTSANAGNMKPESTMIGDNSGGDKIEGSDGHEKTNEESTGDNESASDKTEVQSNRELKLLLALCKEANMDLNISHKRKSVVPFKFSESEILKPKRRHSTGSNSKDGADMTNGKQAKVKDLHNNKVSKKKKDNSQETSIGGASFSDNKNGRPVFSELTMHKDGKDTFCWRCHRSGVNISCETCPRSYHRKCLKQSVWDPNRWPCPECVTILKAESTKTRSPALKGMTLEHLCELLKFAVKRMFQCQGSEPFIHPVNEREFPDYLKYIVQPMDLTCLEKNIKNNLYGSTQAFEADAKWLLHNSIIFNSYQSKLTTVAKQIVKICKQEMAEIENCPSCYLNANTKKNSWFVEVCPKPHILLWAKLKGFPYWPAKAMSTNSFGMVDVRFFGAHDRAWVPFKECFLYSRKDPNSNKQKKNDINLCIKELEVHIDNLKKTYYEFNYAPYRTPFDPEKELEQLKIFIPNYSVNKLEQAKVVIEKLPPTLDEEVAEKVANEKDLPVSTSDLNMDVDDKIVEGYGTDDDETENDLDKEKRREILEKNNCDIDCDEDSTDTSDKIAQNPIQTGSRNSFSGIRMRGGYTNSTGKLKIIPRQSTESTELPKSSSAEEFPEPPQKLCRRNSNGSIKSDSGQLSNLSDKINKVDVSENMELSLGNDISVTENLSDTSDVESTIKKIVQVDVSNKEFSITPPSKGKIADRLIKKLSETQENSDNVEDANVMEVDGEKSAKAPTDLLLENNTAHEVNECDPKTPEKQPNAESSPSKKDETLSPTIGTLVQEELDLKESPLNSEEEDGGENAVDETSKVLKSAHINEAVIRNIIHSSLNDIPIKKSKDVKTYGNKNENSKEKPSAPQQEIDSNKTKNFDNGKTENVTDKVKENVKKAKKSADVETKENKILKQNVDTKNEEKRETTPVKATADGLIKDKKIVTLSPKFGAVDSAKRKREEKEGAPQDSDNFPNKLRKLVKESMKQTEKSKTSDSPSILLKQLQNVKCANAEKTTQNDKKGEGEDPLIEVKIEPLSDDENTAGSTEAKRELFSALKILEKPEKIAKPEMNKPASSGVSTTTSAVKVDNLSKTIDSVARCASDLDSSSSSSSIAEKRPAISTISIKPLGKMQMPKPKARKTFPTPTAIKRYCEVPKKDASSPVTNSQKVASPAVPQSSSNLVILNPPQSVVINSHLLPPNQTMAYSGSAGNQFLTVVQNPLPTFGNIMVPQNVNVSIQQPNSQSNPVSTAEDESQNYIPPSGMPGKPIYITTSTSTTSTTTSTDSIIKSIFSEVPHLVPLSAHAPANKTNAATNTNSISSDTNRQELNEFGTLRGLLPDHVTKALTEITCRPPPKLKPRPPSAIGGPYEEAVPSSAGPVTSKINSVSHRLGDYFRGLLIETLSDLGENKDSLEATVTNLKLEVETLKQKHAVEIMEIKKNVSSILKDIQKSILEERERVVQETKASCEAEAIRRVEDAKSKQWCANCLKEAQFYCCWNTSYCDYPCQQKHWPKHMSKCAQGSSGTIPQPTPVSKPQQLIVRQSCPPRTFGGKTLIAKTQKVIVNRNPNVKGQITQVKNQNSNHITLVESTPGNFEFVGNGPYTLGGKLLNTSASIVSRIKSGSVITVTSPSNNSSTVTMTTKADRPVFSKSGSNLFDDSE